MPMNTTFDSRVGSPSAPSRAAALRLGFTYEGTFRHQMVVKGRNRDTAWFSMIDREWPQRGQAFRRWLDPANFDERGVQRPAHQAGFSSFSTIFHSAGVTGVIDRRLPRASVNTVPRSFATATPRRVMPPW